MAKRVGLAFLLTLILSAFPSPPLAASPLVGVEGLSATITEVTPGGSLLLYSVWRQVDDDGLVRVRRVEGVLEDDDGDGRIDYDSLLPFPALSVWVAVDLTTGEVGLATPPGLGVREIPDPPGGPSGSPEATSVPVHRSRVDLVMARPGAGAAWQAWRGEVRDGNTSDEDGVANGQVRVGVAALGRSLHSPESAPESFLTTDVLVAVDPRTLDVKVIRFNAPGGV